MTVTKLSPAAVSAGEVREGLARHIVDDLRALLNATGLPCDGRKAQLVDRLVDHVLDDDGLHALCEALGPIERAAIADAVYLNSGEHDQRAFEARHGENVDWGWSRPVSMWRGERTAPSLLRVLFCGRSTLSGRSTIPLALHERLREIVPEPPACALRVLAELPATWQPRSSPAPRSPDDFGDDDPEDGSGTADGEDEGLPVLTVLTEATALAELPAVLRLAQAGKLAVGEKTSRPSAATMRSIGAVLVDGDFYDGELPPEWDEEGWDLDEIGPIRAMAWPALLRAAGLAKPFGSKLRLTSPGVQALSAPPASVLRDVWRSWLGTTVLDEFSRIDCIKGQTGKGRRSLTAVASRRDAIGDALTDCPVDGWVAVDELFRYMRANDMDFEVVHRDPWNLYIGGQHYGSLGYDGCHAWNILQARYALAVLLEYAATLGIIDVALIPPHEGRPDYSHMWGTDDLPFLSRYDGLACLRLTPLGAFCLGLHDDYVPQSYAGGAVLEVLSSRRILAAPGGTITPADRLLLDQFAVPDATSQCWRLELSHLLQAAEQGRPPDELRGFLTDRSDQPLPPTVESLIGDATTRSRAVRDLGNATLLECADDEIATSICESPQGRSLCMRAGKRHIVVPARHNNRLRALVRELGYGIFHNAVAKCEEHA